MLSHTHSRVSQEYGALITSTTGLCAGGIGGNREVPHTHSGGNMTLSHCNLPGAHYYWYMDKAVITAVGIDSTIGDAESV